MSEIIQHSSSVLPVPSVAMSVRVGTRDDIAFMDALQKKYGKALGFFSRKMFEGYIDAGNVLIAEEREGEAPAEPGASSNLRGSAGASPSRSVGYCISRDRYLKRDELGAVFQLCVVPGRERGFIGANLLREVFERSSYGCRLYCCWCAQDLPANKFWEAMGFVPIAYRAGGKARSSQPAARSEDAPLKAGSCKLKASPRIHIYWQKRIRAGDVTTPYWFPAKTEGGAIREDRIILPIPPGMRWDEELPILVGTPDVPAQRTRTSAKKRELVPGMKAEPKVATHRPGAGIQFRPVGRAAVSNLRTVPQGESRPTAPVAETSEQKPKADRVKQKADPALIAKARELRDRWMDHIAVNGIDSVAGKYEVGRQISTPRVDERHRFAA